MTQMSVDELASHLSEAIQQVREGETIEIIRDGNTVALLVPALPDAAERRAALARHNALADEIGKEVTWPTNAAETISEMRR
jgi:antitoxin (DNA-binding transcriptional repressor) of toxin-antitoxin stability system